MIVSTALNLVKLPFKRLSDRTILHECLWCGDKAWSGQHHMQCLNPHCPTCVASPEDIIVRGFGDDPDAAAAAASDYTGVDYTNAITRRYRDRYVMDHWIRWCREERTVDENSMMDKLERNGMHPWACSHSLVAFGKGRMAELMLLMAETRAQATNQGWTIATPPQPAIVYCAQTVPHTIDRLVVYYPLASSSIMWHEQSVGISGLIGLVPGVRRHLVADKFHAMRLQRTLLHTGESREIAAALTFAKTAYEPDIQWAPDDKMLLAVARSPDEVITLQSVMSKFPGMIDTIQASSLLAADYHDHQTRSWTMARQGILLETVPEPANKLPLETIRMYELTGSLREDSAYMQRVFERRNWKALEREARAIACNRIIPTDGKLMLREEASDYIADSKAGPRIITNFTLELLGNVVYDDRNREVCHRAWLRIADVKQQVIISKQGLLQSKKLEDELLTQFQRIPTAADLLPAVIDHGITTKWILQDLRSAASKLRTEHGVSFLGWAADRHSYELPGLTVTSQRRDQNNCLFHPSVRNLFLFNAVEQWAEWVPEIPPCCGDLILGILAQITRSYRHCATRPFIIARDSVTVDVVSQIMHYAGQRTIYSVNPNNRENHASDALRGYPMLAAGGTTNASVLLLSDSGGFRLSEMPPQEHIDAAGRFLQAAMLRVVEWCMQKKAAGFTEIKAMAHNHALAKEGEWIMTQVSKLAYVPVEASPTPALEWLFAQIPLEQTSERLTLRDDMVLETDTAGMDLDMEKVTAELRDMDEATEVDGSVIRCKAPILLPALTRFYGSQPATKVVSVLED